MNDLKKINPLWNLHETYTIVQAAALIAGFEPDYVDDGVTHFRDQDVNLSYNESFQDVRIAFCALKNAIIDKSLSVMPRYDARIASSEFDGWGEYPSYGEVGCDIELSDGDASNIARLIYRKIPNWNLTTVSRKDLMDWLVRRNCKPDFFFGEANHDLPEYLNQSHERYAPKLAAAIHAWEATTEINGTTPKKTLEKWLKEHAVKYGLTDEEGNPVKTAIEEIATVANWKPDGGAPKTPDKTASKGAKKPNKE